MKKSYVLYLIISIVILNIDQVHGQELLTLDEALQQGVAANLDVDLEKIDVEIARNNVSRGNAGQLPTVELQGNYDYTYNIEQNIDAGAALPPTSGGGEIPLGGDKLVSTSLRGSITVNYPLFNGFQGRYRYRQLQTKDSLAQKQLMQTTQEVFAEVTEAYLEVAKNQSQLFIIQSILLSSQDRLRRSELANEYGGSNQLEVFQAQVDLNEDSIEYENIELAFIQTKQHLAEVIGRSVSELDFIVEDKVVLSMEKLRYDQLRNEMKQRNISLQVARYNREASLMDLKLAKANRYPTLNASAGMNYQRQSTEQGFPELQETYGPTVGLSLNYTLFDGKQKKTAQKNAELTVQRYQRQLSGTERQQETLLFNTYQAYQNNWNQLRKSRANLATYERNFERTQRAYALGNATGTTLRDAQVNWMNAQNRVNTFLFDLKIAETQLLQISGQLLTN